MSNPKRSRQLQLTPASPPDAGNGDGEGRSSGNSLIDYARSFRLRFATRSMVRKQNARVRGGGDEEADDTDDDIPQIEPENEQQESE